MTKEQLLFSLLRSQIINEPIALSDDCVDSELLRQVLQLAQFHNVAHLAANAVVTNNLSTDESVVSLCENYVMMELANDARRTYALEHIEALFNQHRLAYILLKGAVLRQHYPESWMRNSCDIDVLVHREEMDRATELLMNELQYTVVNRGLHDVTLVQGKVHIELHFDLIEEGRAKQATSVLDNVWAYASRQNDGYGYVLPDELFYFYHIAHMAKHMTNGGCGIRSFIDVWLLNHRFDYDVVQRRALLEQGGLSAFALAVEHLAEVWFSDAEHTPLSRDVEMFVFRSGTYGSNINRVMLTKINFGGKTSYFLPRLFLPYRLMKLKYPVLETYPILLPWFWIVRICRMAFSKKGRSRTKAEMRAVTKTDVAILDQTQRLMQELEL